MVTLNPSVSATPPTFDSGGQQVVAAVRIGNRPSYAGLKAINGLTSITPKIVINRVTTGAMPFGVLVSACETVSDAGETYRDLHYSWNFGDSNGTEIMTDHYTGKQVNANDSQIGPEAGYLYRTPGTYTITLTVSGKDENGDLVTASTTELRTIGHHYVFRGTGGSGNFTLTFNGQTTADIAYAATPTEIHTALLALSNLDANNCRLTFNGTIEFYGPLTGETYTFTGDFSALTGVSGTPAIRLERQSSTSSVVTVTDLTGWAIEYYDSNYDFGNGASDGTIDRPKTTGALLSTYSASGNNKVAYIKRGSNLTINAMTFSNGYSGLRWLPYGSGAKPILSGSGRMTVEMAYGTASRPVKAYGDYVFSNLDVQFTSNNPWFKVYSSNNGTSLVYPYSTCQNVVLDNIDQDALVASGDCYLMSYSGGGGDSEKGGGGTESGIVWNCNIDMGTASKQAIYASPDQWFGMFGGSIQGGDGHVTLDHHIYSNCVLHQVYRYIDFGLAISKSFCINGNAREASEFTAYYLCDGCNIYGTQNALDFSNANNDQGQPGRFTNTIVQFNRIHTGQILTQNLGLYGENISDITIRDNDLWNIGGGGINIGSDFCDLKIYRNRMFNSRLVINDDQTVYCHDNLMETDNSTTSCIHIGSAAFANIDTWDFDNNSYYSPLRTHPLYENNTPGYIAFATWQATHGHDAAGAQADPLFPDPANGAFVVDPTIAVEWPAGFTSLEYSLDGGDTWISYTNESVLDIADDLSESVEVLFRALSPAQSGTFVITATSDAGSLNFASETAEDSVVGTEDAAVETAAQTVMRMSYRRNGTDIVTYTFDWISDSNGNVSMVSVLPVSGQIERVDIIPSASAAPSADYDVTLTDEDGIDVLAGQGVDLSDTADLSVRPGTPLKDGTTVGVIATVVDGLLTLHVANAGDAKAGRVVVYVR